MSKKLPDTVHIAFENGLVLSTFEQQEAAVRLLKTRADRDAKLGKDSNLRLGSYVLTVSQKIIGET